MLGIFDSRGSSPKAFPLGIVAIVTSWLSGKGLKKSQFAFKHYPEKMSYVTLTSEDIAHLEMYILHSAQAKNLFVLQ